jgi:fucose 4-O-acetylase-like acetyltransferase
MDNTIQYNTNRKRNVSIDALKGFAIFCVLWGHAIIDLKNGCDVSQNPMLVFIYSFHMPLFFMISGFFFASSLKLSFKDFLYKKGVQLLLPTIVWGVIFYLIQISSAIANGNEPFYSYLVEYFKSTIYPNKWAWFLRELFISYGIAFVSLKLLKNKWQACLFSILFVLIFPYATKMQRVFLPLFWSGIFLKDNYQFVLKHAKLIWVISGVLFVVGLFFWRGSYGFEFPPPLFEFGTLQFNFADTDNYLFRFSTGIFGGLFWVLLFEMICKSNTFLKSKFFAWLVKIGTNTLAIYLLQRLILEWYLNRWIDFPNTNIWVYNLIVTPLISLIVLIICLLIIKLVKKNKYADLLLFGKEVKPQNALQ